MDLLSQRLKAVEVMSAVATIMVEAAEAMISMTNTAEATATTIPLLVPTGATGVAGAATGVNLGVITTEEEHVPVSRHSC